MPGQRYTDVAGIAEYLGLTDQAVRSLVKRGRIPHTKVGRLLRFDLRRIDEWLKANTVEVAS